MRTVVRARDRQRQIRDPIGVARARRRVRDEHDGVRFGHRREHVFGDAGLHGIVVFGVEAAGVDHGVRFSEGAGVGVVCALLVFSRLKGKPL